MNTSKIISLFHSELKVINVGPQGFSTALKNQGYEVVQVAWIPPAGGDRKMQNILKIMGGLR